MKRMVLLSFLCIFCLYLAVYSIYNWILLTKNIYTANFTLDFLIDYLANFIMGLSLFIGSILIIMRRKWGTSLVCLGCTIGLIYVFHVLLATRILLYNTVFYLMLYLAILFLVKLIRVLSQNEWK